MQTEFVQSQIEVQLEGPGRERHQNCHEREGLGEAATKAVMKNVKELSDTATKTATESIVWLVTGFHAPTLSGPR